MAKLTIEQYMAKLQKQIKQIEANVPLRIAASAVHDDYIERIFDLGSVARGYNRTQELWVADKNLRSNGSHRGKTGKTIKTTYFKSYYDLKAKQNFDPNTVNFRLTNDLQMDLSNSSMNVGTSKPQSGTPIKVNNNLYIVALRRPHNVEKLDGLQKRFGPFAKLTQKERTKFLKINQFELRKLLAA